MKKINIISLFLICVIFFHPLTSFAYTKLPNNNFEYTEDEIDRISKTLRLKNNEIEYLSNLLTVEKQRYEKILQIKNDEIEKIKEAYKNNNFENQKLISNLNLNYNKQIDLYQKVIENNNEKFTLMQNNSNEWKAIANNLEKENNKVNKSKNFWITISSVLAITLIGVSISK